MEKISYKLTEFEGPLDLLLHLISKNKIDICEIQISLLLEQYMQHIELMKEHEMDISSEFLEMAARLVYIKTVSLLPKHDQAEELKKELVGQLIEYQDCKNMAQMLLEKISFDSFVREPAQVDFDVAYKRRHRLKELYQAYLTVLGKGMRKLPVVEDKITTIVARKIISVNSRIVHILRKLWKIKEIKYASLFASSSEKSELVATFLAILELVRKKRLSLHEENEDTIVKLIDGGAKIDSETITSLS